MLAAYPNDRYGRDKQCHLPGKPPAGRQAKHILAGFARFRHSPRPVTRHRGRKHKAHPRHQQA